MQWRYRAPGCTTAIAASSRRCCRSGGIHERRAGSAHASGLRPPAQNKSDAQSPSAIGGSMCTSVVRLQASPSISYVPSTKAAVKRSLDKERYPCGWSAFMDFGLDSQRASRKSRVLEVADQSCTPLEWSDVLNVQCSLLPLRSTFHSSVGKLRFATTARKKQRRVPAQLSRSPNPWSAFGTY